MLDLEINTETIQESFDRIARDMIHKWHLQVNDDLYSFTEIEFYFRDKETHDDNSTHPHTYDAGLWRSHLAGLDITLRHPKGGHGGILIRGLKKDTDYFNGPIRILEPIFISLGNVSLTKKVFGLAPKSQKTAEPIMKTTRHGLSKKQDNDKFMSKPYRYIIDIDNWNKKHMPDSQKKNIKKTWIDFPCND